jgi:hypothetical protein
VYIWSQVQMNNYRIKYGIVTNNIKCQFGLHHCDRHIDAIEMDISFAYFGVRMKKTWKRQNPDVSWHHQGPTVPHLHQRNQELPRGDMRFTVGLRHDASQARAGDRSWPCAAQPLAGMGRVAVEALLTDKTCIHLRSASVRTYTFFTKAIP